MKINLLLKYVQTILVVNRRIRIKILFLLHIETIFDLKCIRRLNFKIKSVLASYKLLIIIRNSIE